MHDRTRVSADPGERRGLLVLHHLDPAVYSQKCRRGLRLEAATKVKLSEEINKLFSERISLT